MSTDRRIKGLKLRQRSLLSSFNAIKQFVDNYDDDDDCCANEVPVRLESIIKLWADLNSVQAELGSLDEANLDEQLKQRTEYESAYYRSKGFLLAKNKNNSLCVSSSPSTNRSPPSSSQVRLPDVKLPVFSGNLDGWLNFHDLFVSLVHSSVELSNIQKFYYLRSSLSGDALKLIQTIPLSANNYVVAWNLLVEHFQNPARLKQSYVDALFEFPSLKRESASELHSLVEKFEANVKVLQQLGEKVQFWDILLIRMLSIRLDPTTRRSWEEFTTTKDAISFKDLTAFIQRKVTVLQNIQSTTVDVPIAGQVKKPSQRPVASNNAAQFNARKCIVCNNHHPLYQCATFSKISSEDKEKEVRRNHLCRNCLRRGHQAKDCSSTSTCRKCRGKHHTQLCSSQQPTSSGQKTTNYTDERSTPAASTSNPPTASVSATIEPASFASVSQGRKAILLATAVVIVVDDSGSEHTARALLDSGSECCFVTESFSQRINAQRKKVHLPIAGIGQASTHARHKLSTTIRSRTGRYSTSLEFLVLPKITIDLPSTSVDTSAWEIPPSIQLADPSFCSTNPIDLILGAEIFFDLFKVSGRIPLGDNLPVLVNSVLGWVVSGRSSHGQPIAPIVANVATVNDVHRLMERFWSIEEDNASPCYSVEEAACEEHFRRTVTRNTEGRYIVRLPLKQDVLSSLVDNRRTALRRFHQLEGRLVRNPNLHQQYRVFVEEYHALGHMQRVTDYENPPTPCYHLPHHGVVREDSTTTKLRVVFDASCKTPNGPSLNDALLVGPTVQEDLRSIIMRARTHPVMLIADIKQMYRQVLVDEQDTPLQRIVWRVSPDTSMETFELKTVTYGTASAPYLATRVLQKLADDERDEYPEAAKVLRKDFYVDDLFSGGRNIAETTALRKQLDALLLKGGFELRKWASNEEAVLEDVPAENRAVQGSVDLDRDPCIKTLGLHWEPSTDQLRYKIQLPTSTTDAPLTKRIALSYIARLFDPLGLVGPVVTTAKIFMQTLWTLKDDDGKIWSWDNELPSAIKERWHEYQSQLHRLNDLRIDRCILLSNPVSVQLHFFSDASEHAYGSCVYVRSTDASGAVKICLLTAKSKVAPLKKQSIPRLELCGALLSAELYEKVTSSLQIAPETFFWVDSTIVLSWLNSSPSTWTTFVANRVSKIQTATQNCSWNHVAGQQNPADHISRGIPAETLLQNDLWWQGSQWLQSDQRDWPIQQQNANQPPEVLMEARKVPAAVTSAAVEPSFVDQFVETFSNFQHMVRVAAYCRRFLQNCRKTSTARAESAHLTVDEQKDAEAVIIRLIQQQSFSNEYKALQQAQTVSAKSRIRWFHPFIGSDQLIRIGGRLGKANQQYDSKHQILLPSSHHFSIILVRYYHEKHLHAAPQLLLNLLRLRYWITGGRSLAKRTVHKCVICVRARPKLLEQFMAELPAARITASRPFSSTGVDYWGPISLKPPHRRAAPIKAYVAVFVCFATKAVHLELVGDLSTAKFIEALRRFVSRRGLCAEIYSDNGRNFVGAANELRQLVRSKHHQKTVARECANNEIRWHFNPPRASHFGGLWEAAIASAQKHFVRVLGTHTLAYDSMETLLAQIECCLNSRPLVPMSDESTDLEALTPGHFLTGAALKAVPDIDNTEIPFNRLRQWQQTQKMYQQLWKRWHLEYLSTLQSRTKWCNPPVHIKKDQLAVIKDENSPPMSWPTGRIIELYPGDDGTTRVVTLQTPNGRYTRPVSKICLLPVSTAAENQSPPTTA
ncbi:uncharacterized protein LOC131679338 [Topomyia yanbarensis]|uniref:uncharacterized protein LOC131679338 n=1 Tax=Topomyia yanbarensis TaxID=2498891 RepID=UPI00273CF3EA|nr:uncharacterized protein LOC131679338 [Topomyia yanbarensis]